MLQYHFAHPPAMPAPTAALNFMSMHKRNNKFTDRIITHGGPKRDTSIDATTKSQQRQKKAFEKKFNAMDSIRDEFEEEMDKIESLRQQIAANQLFMAKCAQDHYAAITIQQAFRGSQARFALTVLKKLRLVRCWLYFRRYFRDRARASSKLGLWIRRYFSRKRFKIVFLQNKAAKKIQIAFRSKKSFKILRVCLTLLSQVKKTRDHILLFAERKAFRKITLLRMPKIDKPNPIISFINCCIRRRRQRLLKTQQGKIAFYVLNNFYNEAMYQPNATIDFIRRKVHQAIPQLAVTPDEKVRRRPAPSPRGSANRPGLRGSGNSPGGSSALNMVVNLSAADLPSFLSGCFRVRSVADAFFLIKDMVKAAIANPMLIDDSILPIGASTPGSAQSVRRAMKSPVGMSKSNTESTSSLGGKFVAAAAAATAGKGKLSSKSSKSLTTIGKIAAKAAQNAKASPGEKTPRPKAHTITGNNLSMHNKSIPDLHLTSVTEHFSDDSDNESHTTDVSTIPTLRIGTSATNTNTGAATTSLSSPTNRKSSDATANNPNKGKAHSFDAASASTSGKSSKNKGTRSSTSDISSTSAGSIKKALEAARAVVGESEPTVSAPLPAESKAIPAPKHHLSIDKKQLEIKEVRKGSKMEITIDGDPMQNLVTDSSSDSIAPRGMSRNPSKALLIPMPANSPQDLTIEGDLNQPLISDSSSESVVRNLSKNFSNSNLHHETPHTGPAELYIMSPSASMLKTEFMSSLAYSDDGSSVAESPFKHLVSTQTSMVSDANPNPMGQSLQSNVSNYYIAGEEEDSDSDFDFEIPDDDMNQLLGVSQDNSLSKNYEHVSLSRKNSAFGIDAEPSLVDTADFKITRDE